MLIFFDTEFTDLVPDAKLVSIGLVANDGREFYAELSDTYQARDVGDFAIDAVIPLLEGGDYLMTQAQLRGSLGKWLESFAQPVKLATDSLAWDWPWICEIFDRDDSWPKNLDGKPLPLSFKDDGEAYDFDTAIEDAFATGLRRHHALDDAKANRLAWHAINGSDAA